MRNPVQCLRSVLCASGVLGSPVLIMQVLRAPALGQFPDHLPHCNDNKIEMSVATAKAWTTVEVLFLAVTSIRLRFTLVAHDDGGRRSSVEFAGCIVFALSAST